MHSEVTNSRITSPTGSTASQAVRTHRQPGPGPIRYGSSLRELQGLLRGRACGLFDLRLQRSSFTNNQTRPSHVAFIEVRPPTSEPLDQIPSPARNSNSQVIPGRPEHL